ncbi:MAG: ABC transporter substrate-binding protein, partial [Chloroflexota bacterium]
MVTSKISRRQLMIRVGTAGLGIVGLSTLAACSQTAAAPTAAPKATTAPTTAPTTAAAVTTAPAVATAAAAAKPLPKGTCTARAMPDSLAGDGALKGKTIKIGVEAPLTGDQARFGLEIQYSTEWVLEQINAKGGLLGAKLVSAPVDDQHTPKIGEAVAQKLIDDPDVMAVIGPFNSAVMMSTSLLYNKAKMATIGPTTS